MKYDFAIDPVTKKNIAVFSCIGLYFPKNGFALTKYHHGWHYYQGNNTWLKDGLKTVFVFNTKEEAELACTQHLNFLKECGYKDNPNSKKIPTIKDILIFCLVCLFVFISVVMFLFFVLSPLPTKQSFPEIEHTKSNNTITHHRYPYIIAVRKIENTYTCFQKINNKITPILFQTNEMQTEIIPGVDINDHMAVDAYCDPHGIVTRIRIHVRNFDDIQ